MALHLQGRSSRLCYLASFLDCVYLLVFCLQFQCLQRAELDAMDLEVTQLTCHKEEAATAKIAQEAAKKAKADAALAEANKLKVELTTKLLKIKDNLADVQIAHDVVES